MRTPRMGFKHTVMMLLILLLAACAPQPANPQGSSSPLLRVQVIDVGQADSILIQTPDGESLLIDGGNVADADKVLNTVRQAGIKKLTAVVATHPHEDHIGGLAKVITEIGTKTLYLPNATATTKTFERLMDAAEKHADKTIKAEAGVKLPLGAAVQAVFLSPAPGQRFEDLNDYSAVVHLKYGDTSFLFTGDAGQAAEQLMLKNPAALKADVLKVGHHGSSTATSDAFLKAVAPKTAVISVGKDNDYGHPHRETLQRLEKSGLKLYRTDRDGSVVISSDSHTLKVDQPKAK